MADSENNACALAVGRKLVATIHDIAFGGEGVARVDGLILFVPFVLMGEEVEVEITDVKKKFARARLLRVLKASPERVMAAASISTSTMRRSSDSNTNRSPIYFSASAVLRGAPSSRWFPARNSTAIAIASWFAANGTSSKRD
jgi:predicted RNA-binding protein with TRAM domain